MLEKFNVSSEITQNR